MKPCSIEGCEKTVYRKGWCKMHHRRWERHGDPLTVKAVHGNPEDRFNAYADRKDDADCWPWTGPLHPKGYGRITVNGRPVPAHRFAYELLVGPVPPGYSIDHICHNPGSCVGGNACPHRRCVNPTHLAAVPPEVNNTSSRCISRNAAKTHCPHGHEYTPENTRLLPSGSRVCRTCAATSARGRRANASNNPEVGSLAMIEIPLGKKEISILTPRG